MIPDWSIRVATAIEVFGRRYEDVNLRAARANIATIRSDWRTALAHFLGGYAYERAGRSPHYARAALDAINEVAATSPTEKFRKDLMAEWKKNLREKWKQTEGVGDKGFNVKLSPFATSSGRHRSVVDVVRGLKDHRYNLFAWAEACLKDGDAENAHELLTRIRGIGPKIASFYLRDVAILADVPALSIESERYLQPIDRWVERIVDALVPKHDDYADAAVALARQAKICPRLFNAGAWYFGKNVVKTKRPLAELLGDEGRFRAFLDERIERYQADTQALRDALTLIRPDT